MRDNGILRKQRPGVCHRCGWRGNVGKVLRRDRRYLVSGNSYGRLCEDCVAMLFHGQSAVADSHGMGHVRLTVVQDRDVA
jgi:hypothetical protein